MSGPDPRATLAEALEALRPGAPTEALKPPTFNWQTTEQYEDFCLFHRLMESWYHLQGIKEEPDDGTRLEYLLNFLGTTGQQKHEQWKPKGATEVDHENKKESAAVFLEYLSSTMYHPMSQQCRIYQLEDVRICTGKTPDELIECICGLAEQCGFPSNEEKERNIQYHYVHALSDSDLVHKLLALKLTATTSEMLELCCTHIAVSDNMNAMGLRGSRTVNVICCQKQQCQQQQPQQQKSHTTSTAQHTCGNCTESHAPGRSSCPAKDSVCPGCGHTGNWQLHCRSSGGPQATKKPEGIKKKQGGHHHKCHQCGYRHTDVVDVGADHNPQLNEVNVAGVTLQHDHE